ncbi:MAG: ATP-binding cassette domain-containing protein [Planctomycetes bacterium]|nr:ATP-binding cassette domain-containing protein [Planctomycetota bacterium]
MRKENDKIMCFQASEGDYVELPCRKLKGQAIRFSPMSKQSTNLLQRQSNWFAQLLFRFYRLMIIGLVVSIFMSVLALSTPIFVMSIYGLVQVAGADPDLGVLALGVLLYILMDFAFKLVRMGIFNFMSARLSYLIGGQVMRRVLFLPPSLTEAASPQSQVGRIREFETINEFFSGTAMSGILDFLTTVFLLGGMAWIGGNLVYVPLGALMIAIAFGAFIRSMIVKSSLNNSNSQTKCQELLHDIVFQYRNMRTTAMGNQLLGEYKKLSLDAGLHGMEVARAYNLVNLFSTTLSQCAGLATMAYGVIMVMEGTLQSGALLACMLLTWKIIAPVRSLFSVLTQAEKTIKSIGQLDRLMNLAQEVEPDVVTSMVPKLKGQVNFNSVSMRSRGDQLPSLLNVSLAARQGKITLICGHGGMSGAYIIDALMLMRDYQSGSISIGGMNIRQFDPLILRKSIAYAPSKTHLFEMSLRENLLCVNPIASEEEIDAVIVKAGLIKEMSLLKNGLDTMVDGSEDQFSESFKKRMGFARAWLRDASVICYHKPELGITKIRIDELINNIFEDKETRTTIVVSNNPDLFRIADDAIWLDQGRIRIADRADKVAEIFYNES